MSTNDALIEAMLFAVSWIESGRPIDGLAQRMREALAASKPEPQAADNADERAEPGITDAMVTAYLEANEKYWVDSDKLPIPPDRWRTGNPRDATRAGLIAALLAADKAAGEVYPPDGTTAPFTVINLGHGKVQMGDSIHDDRLPALWFGKEGKGMGHVEELNRRAKEGETLAVVTFSNVEGLDVLLDVIFRIRGASFQNAPSYTHPQPQAVPDDVAKDAERYQRLRILGCAPMGTTHLEKGLVMRFTNLDAFLDDDIKHQPSRGEWAIDAAMLKEGK